MPLLALLQCSPTRNSTKAIVTRTKNPAPDLHRRYRGIVGSLGYLVTMKRPDLAWAYSELSKYVQFPGKNNMLAAERVLSYLQGTWNKMVRYSRYSHETPNVLWGWVIANLAGNTDTRRSHMGYILMMNGGLISWKSRRQDNMSLSTSKAEFIVAGQAGQEAIYLRETLTDFGYSQTKAILLYEDNPACTTMSDNPVRRKFSSHIDIKRYFVRELVLAGFLKLVQTKNGG